MDERDKLTRDAVLTAGDRQRALDEVCRSVLAPFIGRKITPTLVAEAEATMRAALIDAIRAGKYVLPDGMTLDRVELGPNMRLQVYFNRERIPNLGDWVPLVPDVPQPKPCDLTVDAILAGAGVEQRATFRWVPEAPAPVAKTKLMNRYEAVAAEIDNNDDSEEEPT